MQTHQPDTMTSINFDTWFDGQLQAMMGLQEAILKILREAEAPSIEASDRVRTLATSQKFLIQNAKEVMALMEVSPDVVHAAADRLTSVAENKAE